MRQGTFQDAHEFTAKWEGGLSDHPADRGGLTAYGATMGFVQEIAATASGKNFLQATGVSLPITRAVMRQLRPGQVAAMFRREFWDALKLDDLPFRQAALLYDAAVNHGPATGVKISQRGYNRCVTHGVPLAVDGILGPLSRKALAADTDKMVAEIIQARREFYEAIVAARPDQGVFLKGWINRADALEKLLLG